MRIAVGVTLACLCVGVVTGAQTQKDRMTILGTSDLSAAGREAITAIDELGPESATGWHTHLGDMVGFVTAGSVVIEQRGKAPLTVGGIHAQMFVTYIVDRDKPLSAPAAAQ